MHHVAVIYCGQNSSSRKIEYSKIKFCFAAKRETVLTYFGDQDYEIYMFNGVLGLILSR